MEHWLRVFKLYISVLSKVSCKIILFNNTSCKQEMLSFHIIVNATHGKKLSTLENLFSIAAYP